MLISMWIKMPNSTARIILILLMTTVITGCSTPARLTNPDPYANRILFTVSDVLPPSSLASGYAAQSSQDTKQEDDSDTVIEAILSSHGLTRLSEFRVSRLGIKAIVAETDGDELLNDIVNAMAEDKRVESVQKVNAYKLLAYNDPYYSLQNTVNADRIEHIHEISTGKNVAVGIIDTGVDRYHPELADRIIYTKNFVQHDQSAFDMDEHGTAVAGVIGSAANNDLGIVGVAPDVNLMIFKACYQDMPSRRTSCDSVSIIKALNAVLEQRPDILNLSLAGPRDPMIARLLRSAHRDGVVLVAAVDEKRDLASSFPANMDVVIAVASTLQTDMLGDVVLAPGTDMLTTTPGATYGFKSGSSMATAYVSGIAALIKESAPGLSSSEVQSLLRQSARMQENTLPVVDMCLAVSHATGSATDSCERVRSLAAASDLSLGTDEITN